MEEQFQQVTNIINELAASNPYITKEQIAKARSMYNGDMRPIDQIRAELEAYSEQIMVQGKKYDKDRELAAKKPETVEAEKSPRTVEETPAKEKQPTEIVDNYAQVMPAGTEEILDSLKVDIPGDDKRRALQSMIDEALGEQSEQQETEYSHEQQPVANKESAKVLVKQQNEQTPNSAESTSSESGYGNVTALLSLTIICSIITIIIAVITILSN